MYKHHTHCRACDDQPPTPEGIKVLPPAQRLARVFSLGLQPLANDFCKVGDECAGYAPLEVMLCPNCHLGQLSVTVRPDILYSQYKYVTSTSQMMHDHLDQLAKDICQETGRPMKETRVLEIGSNDGLFLRRLKSEGANVHGIDPAANLCQTANDNGVPTTCAMFSPFIAKDFDSFDVVIARHVFCHVDDWKSFIRGLEMLSHRETTIWIEVPYVRSLLDRCEFDTIYHEHLSYFTLTAMSALLAKSSLRLHHVIHYPIHGGAIVLVLRRRESKSEGPRESIQKMLVAESQIDWAEAWGTFSHKAQNQIQFLGNHLRNLARSECSVAALGASAKSTVWINACKLTRKEMRFIADSTKGKWYTLSPGSDIPIVDEGAILRDLPSYVVLFAWNYLKEILTKNQLYHEKGGRFIVPVPEVTVM